MKQIKQTIQSLHLSANPSESKSPPAKSKSKVKPKKKAVANKSEVSSKANASVSEEVEHHPSSRMISVTPDIVEISDRNLMKVKKKHREHSNPKEEVHKNKHLKNLKSGFVKLLEDQRIQFLIQFENDIISDSDSENSKDFDKVNVNITRKKLKISKQVKNQIVQTDDLAKFTKRNQKRSSIMYKLPQLRKSIRGKSKKGGFPILENQSQDERSEVSIDDDSYMYEERVFLSKDLVNKIKETLRKEADSKRAPRGSFVRRSTIRGAIPASKGSRSPHEKLSLSSTGTGQYGNDMIPYSVNEVRTLLESMLEKLLI